jgi:hypothetical protein
MKYLEGVLSSFGARQAAWKWPINPKSVQNISSVSYFRLTQDEELSSRDRLKPGFKGFETSMLTKILK